MHASDSADLLHERLLLLATTLVADGRSPAVGVPCSLLAPFFDHPDLAQERIFVPREDIACGIAAGLAIAGRRPILFFQNSGLLAALNPLTLLLQMYQLDVVVVVSMREASDEAPEHSSLSGVTWPALRLIDGVTIADLWDDEPWVDGGPGVKAIVVSPRSRHGR